MVSRRGFLCAAALAGNAASAAPQVKREMFLKSPGKGTAVLAHAAYTSARGGGMISAETRMSRSDTADVVFMRRSSDNGRSWTAAEEWPTKEKRPDGTLRRHLRGGWVEPRTGRYIEFRTEGVLPTDQPLEGMSNWNLYYRISADGGRSWGTLEQVIHEGSEYGPRHSLPTVHTGKTCVMLGDLTCQPVARADGAILLPAQVTRLGPDGKLYNPTGGHTYTSALVLIGKWKGAKLTWTAGQPIEGDPARSTRGMVEPTLGWLDDGRLMVVMRGSNDRTPKLPSYKWVSYSEDGGMRWSTPAPWTYDDGQTFFSPSACSQLLKHSSGRMFWLGNITPANPAGNRPRYPFVIGEVDRKSGLLIRASVRAVDDRQPDDHELLTLSNFLAREDRETKEVCVHMTRLFGLNDGWSGDAYLYRIAV